MKRILLGAAFFLASAPATASAQDEPPPPPELVQAGEAWTECVTGGVDGVPARQQPREAARAILSRCSELQARMLEAHDRWIDASALSPAEKERARAETRRSIQGMEAQIVQAIRDNRAPD